MFGRLTLSDVYYTAKLKKKDHCYLGQRWEHGINMGVKWKGWGEGRAATGMGGSGRRNFNLSLFVLPLHSWLSRSVSPSLLTPAISLTSLHCRFHRTNVIKVDMATPPPACMQEGCNLRPAAPRSGDESLTFRMETYYYR